MSSTASVLASKNLFVSASARFIVLSLSARSIVLAPSSAGNGVTFPEKWLAVAC